MAKTSYAESYSLASVLPASSELTATSLINASDATASDNSIFVKSALLGDLYGGYSLIEARSSNAESISVSNNTGSISDSETTSEVRNSKASSYNNNITVDVDYSSNIYGGYAAVKTVSLKSFATRVDGFFPVKANADTKIFSSSAIANNNTIKISSIYTGNIYAGYSTISSNSGEASASTELAAANSEVSHSSVEANHNSVYINNNITGNVYGGYGFIIVKSGNVTGTPLLSEAHVNLFILLPNW